MEPFPLDSITLEVSLGYFSKVSAIVSGFVAAVFVMRAVFLQVRIASPTEYGELMTDLVGYFGITAVFPFLIKYMMNSISAISKGIQFSSTSIPKSMFYGFVKDLFGDYAVAEVFGRLGSTAVLIAVQGFYSVLFAVLLGIAPIIIFSGTVLKLTDGIKEYFNIILSMALWPVLWNLLGLVGKGYWDYLDTSPFRTWVFWCVIQLLQILSPIFCILLFKSMSSAGVVMKIIMMGRRL